MQKYRIFVYQKYAEKEKIIQIVFKFEIVYDNNKKLALIIKSNKN